MLLGSIPIVQDQEHVGRNQLEKKLGYKFLLASEFLARYKETNGTLPYCKEWAQYNFNIFLRAQTLIANHQTVSLSADR